ncbi:uncharacterized protein [Maniola hyperantus]|uniref:uncharacterized protein n=1 Tax=Aphantopus hyperantus TaxID=2795564 RepID=UPI001567E0AA|nr:uncharacterized protein LOC117991717 [Maniola hyperantus]XP_034835211.1 uncharacterized protein LOC117991717 [Maniola hyperantus]
MASAFVNYSNFMRQALHKLIPSSIIGEVACFVFYDHHPRDEKCLDVTICTKSGEVLEYYQRELISSLLVENTGEVKEIKILRNSKCELFYLLETWDEILILSKNDKLQVHNRISNIESYKVEDLECTGQASLKVIRKNDAIPLVFDDNFNHLTEKRIELNNAQSEELLPVVKQLMKKLTEAKYTTNHNEQKYKDYVNMRQAAAFSLFQRTTLKLEESVPKLRLNEISNLLQVTVKPPIVKMCNEKVVIIISLKNNNNVPIKEVCVLLHSDLKQSVEHSTKVFETISKPPHWRETDAEISSYNKSTVVATVDLKELQFDVASRIEFEITLSYTKSGKIQIQPIESVSISPLDIMGENSDVLHCSDIDSTYLVLSVLATSECFDLRLRHITKQDDNVVTLSDIFHKYLKMEKCLDNVAIHKFKPFHKLYGVMVVFNDNIRGTNIMNVQVYTRFPSQVLALMHYMYDAVPHRIIATTSDYRISEINNDLSNYTEKSQTTEEINYKGCASSIMNQTKLIKEFIDECTLKMSEDRSPEIQEKVGTEVDLMALGVPKYLEFRDKVLEESLRGIKSISLHEDPPSFDDDLDCMIIDD